MRSKNPTASCHSPLAFRTPRYTINRGVYTSIVQRGGDGTVLRARTAIPMGLWYRHQEWEVVISSPQVPLLKFSIHFPFPTFPSSPFHPFDPSGIALYLVCVILGGESGYSRRVQHVRMPNEPYIHGRGNKKSLSSHKEQKPPSKSTTVRHSVDKYKTKS